MVIILMLLWLAFGCASLNKRSHFAPRHLHWRAQTCDPALTDWAYRQLLKGEGNAELSLYYMRCRERPAYLDELNEIKRRWK